MKRRPKNFYRLSIFAAIMAIYGVANAATTSTPIAVNNKTSKFNAVLSETGASASDTSTNELADTIRRQRALLDAQNTKTTSKGNNSPSGITTSNACDKALRDCMTEKCGENFTKCAKDSTTIWGNKMDSCRRNTKCTGHEYSLIAPEILADRDAYIKLSYYQSVVDCGEMYKNCIFDICGKTMNGCLSKSAGDSAVAKCKSIADQCKEYDNGLAARVMGVFGDLRTIATKNVARDEQELYKLRDLMQTQCTRLGAMFDERTLDCVFTVNFFAGEDNTLMASKKLYAGDTFKCEPEWFGIDITTFKENAYRLTRSQKSASMAALGAGVGTAAGLWTSGAVTRAMNTQDAESAAKEQCIANGGEWVSAGFNKGKECDMTNAEENLAKRKQQKDETDLSDDKGDNPEETLSIQEAQCNMFDSSICNGNGNCTWDPMQNNGRGKCIAKTNSSNDKGNNAATESDFVRPNAKGAAPTDEQLERDTSGRTCRKYYTDDWCKEYYALYNKEKADQKAATKEQGKQRRQQIVEKLGAGVSNVTHKIGTGISNAAKAVGTGVSNAAQAVGNIFKPKNNEPEPKAEEPVDCEKRKTELTCTSYDNCWWSPHDNKCHASQ